MCVCVRVSVRVCYSSVCSVHLFGYAIVLYFYCLCSVCVDTWGSVCATVSVSCICQCDVCNYVCVHPCLCVCKYVGVCMYVFTYACMYLCMWMLHVLAGIEFPVYIRMLFP